MTDTLPTMNETTQPSSFKQISGVYPHLCTYTFEPGEEYPELSECGIGAIVPWADRLWMITYAAHQPKGSTHKLYSVDEDLNLTIHPESVGGTPAARMIHTESNQLLIGHYLIDAEGNIRVISPEVMPGRLTAIARHLTDPENMVYYVDMEGMIYEANVHTLEVTKLFHKPVPGWHGKGAYTSQGRLVVSNNGEHGPYKNAEEHFQVEDHPESPERAGVLAEWDGDTWTILERRQFTDVTGPGGIYGAPDDNTPLWSIGWDKRSLRLKLLDGGTWRTFLLPKATHTYDPKHGWFTEWPRIRDIGNGRMMMDMHGMFFEFPKTFSAANTAGIRPISSHMRYIPDFCDWNGQLVIATDESTIMGHAHCGQPQSNLWFGSFEDLKAWGPRSGFGGPWVQDAVQADSPSDPFLIAGFDQRILHLITDKAATCTIEIDSDGTGSWKTLETVTIDGYTPYTFDSDLKAEWMRLTLDTDCTATAYFHGTDKHLQSLDAALFEGLAEPGQDTAGGLLFPALENRNLKLLFPETQTGVDLTCDLEFESVDFDAEVAETVALEKFIEVDDASVVIREESGEVFRLPKGTAALDADVGNTRELREVESERNLANLHGTFYEIPRGGKGYRRQPNWELIRPVSSHNKRIHDYCTWQGLLVLSGVHADAPESGHIVRGENGEALWLGAIDDLWQLGKPVGEGGPWKDTAVKAGEASDPYLMTGYDRKTLSLTADQDVTVTAEINIDHQSGWVAYRTFDLKAGETATYEFPEAFSAHWIRFKADHDCVATAWLVYS